MFTEHTHTLAHTLTQREHTINEVQSPYLCVVVTQEFLTIP